VNDVERAVEAAVVRITDDGRTRGTGFLISSDLVLTCDHVVGGLHEALVEAGNGTSARADVERADDLRRLDLALLRCRGLDAEPLPIAIDFARPLDFWTKGFQYAGGQIRNALPVEGTVTGATDVTYHGTDGEYRIDGALVLSNAEIDHGLSGAPVVDAAWGAAVGIVNTSFRAGAKIAGFALPFSAARNAAAIEGAIGTNRATVPAFGPYLNRIAAISVCQRSVDRSLRRLKTSAQLVLEHYCPRSLVARQLDEFIDGDAHVFPLVGPSGVGKTTELAHLARQRPATLLIPATALAAAPAQDGIAGVLDHELRSSAGRVLPKENALGAVVEALAEESCVLVLLDALNEAPPELRTQLNDWIAVTVEWLQDTGSKLVVTSRPEYWAGVKRVVPDDVLFAEAAANRNERSVTMTDFTEDEAAAALSAYDLTDTRLAAADIRHPFMARIYWEMRGEHAADAQPLGRLDALARYVQLQVLQLAHKTAVPAPTIERVLEQAARDLTRSSLMIERERVAELAAVSETVVAGVIAASILVETPDGRYRFAFDEVAEFLRLRHVDLDDLRREEFLDACADGTVDLPYGTLVLAFLQFEQGRGSREFGDLLDELLARRDKESSWFMDFLLGDVFADAADPEAVFPTLQRFAEAAVAVNQFHGAFAVERVLPRIRLSLERRFELLRVLVRGERSYEWEPGHWEYPRSEFGRSLVAEVRANAPASFSLLLSWWEDDSPLFRENATVAHVGRGLMYLAADAAFEDLLKLLAEQTDALSTGYGWQLAQAHPELTLAVCERWAQKQVRQELCARFASAIVHVARVRERSLKLLVSLLASEDATTHDTAMRALQEVPEMRPLVVDEVFVRYQARDPSVDAALVGAALATDFERAFAALSTELETGSTERRSDVLNQLRTYRTSDVEEAALVLTAIEAAWSPTSELAWMVGLAVEYRLYALADTPQLAPQALALAERIIREGDDDARHPLGLYALGASPRDEAEAELMRGVLGAFLAAADNGRELGQLLTSAARSGQDWALDPILAHAPNDPEAFELAVVQLALMHDEKARPVLSRLAAGQPYAPSASAVRLLELVAGGSGPQDAAKVVLDIRLDRAADSA
jgi:hypothetical protein